MQEAGHKPIVVIGTATAKVGDPSGKNEDRPILTQRQIADNSRAIARQTKSILGDNTAIEFNGSWLESVYLPDFLRYTGRHFRVNQMITEEPVRSRLANGEGISFTEFTYKLLQAMDFSHLTAAHNCIIQIGGQDQRSNIIAGIDLNARTNRIITAGVLCPLLTDSKGHKIGKTSTGQKVWLDPNLTSPFDFFQFWIRQVDTDAQKMLRMFTTIPEKEIPKGAKGRKMLALSMTELVHGSTAAMSASEKTKQLFTHGDTSGVESIEIHCGRKTIAELFFVAGMTRSRTETRHLARGGGLWVNGSKVEDATKEIDLDKGEEILLQVGKKRFRKVIPR